jgi:ribonuclease I
MEEIANELKFEPEVKLDHDYVYKNYFEIREYLMDILSESQLKEFIAEINGELSIRSVRESRLAKMKKELANNRNAMKKELKDEEYELRLAMNKKLRKQYDEDDDPEEVIDLSRKKKKSPK